MNILDTVQFERFERAQRLFERVSKHLDPVEPVTQSIVAHKRMFDSMEALNAWEACQEAKHQVFIAFVLAIGSTRAFDLSSAISDMPSIRRGKGEVLSITIEKKTIIQIPQPLTMAHEAEIVGGLYQVFNETDNSDWAIDFSSVTSLSFHMLSTLAAFQHSLGLQQRKLLFLWLRPTALVARLEERMKEHFNLACKAGHYFSSELFLVPPVKSS